MIKKKRILILVIASALITMACACPITNLINQFTNPEPQDLLEMIPDDLMEQLPEDMDEMLEEVITAVPDVIEEGLGNIPEALGEGDMQDLFNQGVPENLPMVEEYDDLFAMGGILTYSTPTSFEDMVAFYENNMVNYGWTKDDSSSVISTDMQSGALNFFNDEQTATIAIAVVDNKTTVSIIVANK